MADHAATAAHDDHGHDSNHVKIYLRVFISLTVLTLIEYFYAHIFKDTFTALVLGLMTWALIKAALVGLYFMHVKYEGKWIYAMLLPAGFLATFLMIMLYPDMVLHENASDVATAEAQAAEEDEAAQPVTMPLGAGIGQPASRSAELK